MTKAQKFGSGGNEDDDDLEEESLFETPLDKVEPYGLFKETLMSKFCASPFTPGQLFLPSTNIPFFQRIATRPTTAL